MQKKAYLSLAIIIFFLSLVPSSSVAQESNRFTHSIDYDIGGRVSIDRSLGHACTTGATKDLQVRGYGELKKSEDVRIDNHIISVDDTMNFRTAVDAIRNLSVMTAINLCARPIYIVAEDYIDEDTDEVLIERGEKIDPYHPLVIDGTILTNPATRQIWAHEITPEPGEVGQLDSDFIAAYGPGPYALGGNDNGNDSPFLDEDYMWWYDEDERDGIYRGDFYVGNYFDLDHYAYVSSGETRRLIEISSPFSHSYLFEEYAVRGMSEIRDTFMLDNLEPGPRAIRLTWYELF